MELGALPVARADVSYIRSCDSRKLHFSSPLLRNLADHACGETHLQACGVAISTARRLTPCIPAELATQNTRSESTHQPPLKMSDWGQWRALLGGGAKGEAVASRVLGRIALEEGGDVLARGVE